MNTKQANKGLDPTSRYKISTGQSVVFQEQRSNLEFLALSEANSELAKKNRYHHHLDTVDYQRQVTKWGQEDVTKKATRLQALAAQLGERTVDWISGQKPREIGPGCRWKIQLLKKQQRAFI